MTEDEGGRGERLSDDDRARIVAEVDAMSPRGAGWWHADTGRVLENACFKLVALGVSVDRATAIIGDVKDAIADEYGD